MPIKRDETLPRVSDILKFLYIEELESIPRDILEAAAEEGRRKHKLIEDNWNTDLDHPIVNMFRRGLKKVMGWIGDRDITIVIDYKFTRDKLRAETALQKLLYGELVSEGYQDFCKNKIVIERQINGYTFTGKPDFVILNMLSDAYDVAYFAFHYHQDGGLFVYKIPDRAKEPLLNFALSLVEHHEDITAGKLIKYDKLLEWDKLQREYDVFEIFYCTMPPMTVTSELEAKTAVMMFRDLQKVEKYKKHLASELMRYMESEDKTVLYDPTGGGVRLQTSNRKEHDKKKLNAYKKTIITGTKEIKSLVRFSPPIKKQKLIN
jgi:hypothetical protein